MNTLSVNHLSLTYKNGFQAIKDISLEIGNGMFGLLGPNGAGKSSLMKTIVGLQKPTSGSIVFNGVNVSEDPDYIKQNLGFLPQDFGVYPKVSAYDLLEHIALLKGISNRTERKKQILNLLEKVNLSDFRKKEVHTFSGGMRQRFGVAQALLGNPKIIIVDEPTAGLDPEERNRFNSLLNDISKDVIVILSTHLVEDVRNLCSEMAIMNKGQVLRKGKPNELIAELENKIWSKPIDKSELENYRNIYHIISQQLIERELYITTYSPERPKDFLSVNPLLEHVYFHTLTQKP
ncbi:ABC transporter ATP-binding protein [Elizabethkingia anophelis]|uniref:ABC transporter ATP-binding protein n=1 Tax=Elizabethkingia anophelis TaxID=1117645 RepID=UPI00136F974D|nr:ABC transporter ATP-binding protein [Elizabethkingia anophelis]MCL1035184.1 ABC transporter ATP-binding protein [Elizabethkingia anophelis]MCW2464451.1 ABC-type multidrug transport system ATPase subunit [Elizabethkingia anophelis]MCW2468134.1 ABC-type multidrug transport system ATPase subunit [Elizabethkingia anophelis]MCW2471818.1 ABC-type multidrug transport system ATPase subunit [Elizabethkingia anophelis]MYY26942.1 ABC transporter ATP-binding protein [Elizabethkingia anophelis]